MKLTRPILSLDRIAELLREKGCVGAYVGQTGGGCAMLCAGTGPALPGDAEYGWGPRYAVMAGPGSFYGPGWNDARCDLGELNFAADDDGDSESVYVNEGTEEEIADRMFAFILSRPDCKLELAEDEPVQPCLHCGYPVAHDVNGEAVCRNAKCFLYVAP